MFNLEEEIKAWKYLLDIGEIDEITYNEEINKLKLKDEKRKNHKNMGIYFVIPSAFCRKSIDKRCHCSYNI